MLKHLTKHWGTNSRWGMGGEVTYVSCTYHLFVSCHHHGIFGIETKAREGSLFSF